MNRPVKFTDNTSSISERIYRFEDSFERYKYSKYTDIQI